MDNLGYIINLLKCCQEHQKEIGILRCENYGAFEKLEEDLQKAIELLEEK